MAKEGSGNQRALTFAWPVQTWDALVSRLNESLREELIALGRGNQRVYGMRDFLQFLHRQPQDSLARAVLDALELGQPINGRDIPPARALHIVISQFKDEYLLGSQSLAATTRYSQFRILRMTLEWLSIKGVPGVPEYRRHQHVVGRTPYADGDGYKSLGDAEWPELEGLSGMDRHRHALWLVRQAYSNVLKPHLKLFEFGQRLRSDPDFIGATRTGTETIREGIRLCEEMFRESGRVTLPNYANSRRCLSRSLLKRLRSPGTWLSEAGVDLADLQCAQRHRSNTALQSCIGATTRAVEAAVGLVMCDTGWNLGPAADLPREPFVFRTSTGAYIAHGGFISSYKGRKGDDVYAYIEERDQLDGNRLEIATELWRATVRDIDPNGLRDGYAELPINDQVGGSLYSVLMAFTRMSQSLISLASTHDNAPASFPDSLWLHIKEKGRVAATHTKKFSTADVCYRRETIFKRPECHAASIRKTWQTVNFAKHGSVGQLRPFAGHARSNVLMPHYLNTSFIKTQLDDNIRTFQGAVEAVVLREFDRHDISINLKKPSHEIEQALEVARESGLSATLGLAPVIKTELSKILVFKPTQDRLRELFSIHRQLRRMYKEAPNRARFRIRYLPVLAVVKALGSEVFRTGLGPSYWRAARSMAADLRSGAAVLPVLGD